VIISRQHAQGGEAKNLLRDLQSRNERLFLFTLLIVNFADNKQELENNVFQVSGTAQKHNCVLTRLDYQQESALMSSVPIGKNLIPIERAMTTSATAIFVPFVTRELFQSGEARFLNQLTLK
jgi:type IV secretory pathway VirB4 component